MTLLYESLSSNCVSTQWMALIFYNFSWKITNQKYKNYAA